MKTGSLLLILYGAASLLAIVLSAFSAERAEQYGLTARLASPLPIASVVFAVLVPLTFLIAGLIGLKRADMPNSAKPCFFLGLLILLFVITDVIYAGCVGLVTDITEFGGCVLHFVVTLLYIFGAWRNWKQPKPAEE
ncbi:MAG: hypothetical protein ACI4GO_08105 [Hominenteromicrobium sp.]